MDRQKLILAGASAASLVGGALAGYFYAKKQVAQVVADINAEFEEELRKTHEHYKTLYKVGPKYASPQTVAGADPDLKIYDEAAEATLRYQGRDDISEPVEVTAPLPKEVRKNIFEEAEMANGAVDKLWEQELHAREAIINADPRTPYVISADEFLSNESGFDQVTLTWYRGDAVLVNEREEPVQEGDVDGFVGIGNLSRFGHWSEEAGIVYVRNPRINTEFEIHRNENNYAVSVLGYEPPPVRTKRPNGSPRQRFGEGHVPGGIPTNDNAGEYE